MRLYFRAVIFCIMTSFVALSSFYADDLSDAISHHMNLASTYEQRAAELDLVINEHMQMKKDYKKRFFVNEEMTPTSDLKKMEQHCDAIVRDANRLKSDFLGLREWHQLLASDLKPSPNTNKNDQSGG